MVVGGGLCGGLRGLGLRWRIDNLFGSGSILLGSW